MRERENRNRGKIYLRVWKRECREKDEEANIETEQNRRADRENSPKH